MEVILIWRGMWIVNYHARIIFYDSTFKLPTPTQTVDRRMSEGGGRTDGHVFWHGLGVKLSLYGGRIVRTGIPLTRNRT